MNQKKSSSKIAGEEAGADEIAPGREDTGPAVTPPPPSDASDRVEMQWGRAKRTAGRWVVKSSATAPAAQVLEAEAGRGDTAQEHGGGAAAAGAAAVAVDDGAAHDDDELDGDAGAELAGGSCAREFAGTRSRLSAEVAKKRGK